jgi:tetratricopeptide (TPR) repeat protein
VTHLLRARARAATGDLSGALADWDRALELQPGFFAALFNRGVTRLARGDTSGGTADLEHAVRANPGSIDAWYHLAAGRVALGQRGGAAEAYRRALAGAPPDWALRPQVERALAALGTAHRDPSR